MEEKDITLLGYAMGRCFHALSACLSARLKQEGLDLTHTQYVVLRALHQKWQLSQAQLARLLQKNPAAIMRTIDALIDKGLVVRQTVSRRQYSICVTERGKELGEKSTKIADQTMKQLVSHVAPERQQMALTFLEEVYHEATGSHFSWGPFNDKESNNEDKA